MLSYDNALIRESPAFLVALGEGRETRFGNQYMRMVAQFDTGAVSTAGSPRVCSSVRADWPAHAPSSIGSTAWTEPTAGRPAQVSRTSLPFVRRARRSSCASRARPRSYFEPTSGRRRPLAVRASSSSSASPPAPFRMMSEVSQNPPTVMLPGPRAGHRPQQMPRSEALHEQSQGCPALTPCGTRAKSRSQTTPLRRSLPAGRIRGPGDRPLSGRRPPCQGRAAGAFHRIGTVGEFTRDLFDVAEVDARGLHLDQGLAHTCYRGGQLDLLQDLRPTEPFIPHGTHDDASPGIV